jgi:hypothetical protein
MSLSAAGQTLEVPLFVLTLSPASPQSAFASAFILLCLPPPDVPAGTPGRAAFGAKVFDAALTLKGVFPSTLALKARADARKTLWRALAIAWLAGKGQVDGTSARELQATDTVPKTLGCTARKVAKRLRAAVACKLTEAGEPVAGATVTLRGGQRVLTGRTNAAGTFTGSALLRATTARLAATAVIPARDTSCLPGVGPAPTGACTISGATLTATVPIRR